MQTIELSSRNMTANENNQRNIQRKTAANGKRRDRNTSHIKLKNKCNVEEEDEESYQLEVEK